MSHAERKFGGSTPKPSLPGGGGGLVLSAKMAAALTPSYVLRSQPCPHHHHHHHLTAGNCSGSRGSAGRGGGGAEPELRLPLPTPSPQFVTPGCWGQSRPCWAATGRKAPVPPLSPSPARAIHGCSPDLQNKNREVPTPGLLPSCFVFPLPWGQG